MEKYGDYTIIVRSVGERTERKCIERLCSFFETDDIKIVKNVTPFTEAIKESFNLGINDNKKWSLIVDADVLLYNEKLEIFLNNCERRYKKNNKVFCFQAYLYDNFFEECRLAGVHLFQTKFLKIALPFADNNKGRPESWVIRNMSWEGYPCYVIETCIGIHDFFQAYSDIVAKGMLHAQKHSNIDLLEQKWEEGQERNSDFKWILKGTQLIRDVQTEEIKVDSNWYRRIIMESNIDCPEQEEVLDSQIKELLKRTCGIEQYHELIVAKENALKVRHGLVNYLISKIKSKGDGIWY